MKRFFAVLALAILCGSLFAAPDNSASLSLDGNIGVNFYLDLGDSAYEGATKVVITSPDPTKNDTTSTVQTVVAKADWPDEYRFGIAVAPVQMTRSIKVEIFNGDTLLATAFNNTAKSIADNYVTDADANLQNLAKALLVYCAAAQTEFDYNTSNLANAGVSFSLTDPDWSEIPTLTYGRVNEDPSLTLEKIGFNSLASSQVNFKFTMAAGTTLADYTVAKTFGGDGLVISKQAELDGTYMVVTVSNITSLDLNETFTFDIKKGGSTVYTVNGSALSYMKYVSATKPDFAKAAYNYGKYAEAYFGNDTNTTYVYTFAQFKDAMASEAERVVLRSDIAWDDSVATKIQLDFTGRTLDLGGYMLSNVPGSGYFNLKGDSFTVKNGSISGRSEIDGVLGLNYRDDKVTNKDGYDDGTSSVIIVSNVRMLVGAITQGKCYVHYTHVTSDTASPTCISINTGSAIIENCNLSTAYAKNGRAVQVFGCGTVTFKGNETKYNHYTGTEFGLSVRYGADVVIDGTATFEESSTTGTKAAVYFSSLSGNDTTGKPMSLTVKENSKMNLVSNIADTTGYGGIYIPNNYDSFRTITVEDGASINYTNSNPSMRMFWTSNSDAKICVRLEAGSHLVANGEELISIGQIGGQFRQPGFNKMDVVYDENEYETNKLVRDLRGFTHTHNGESECPTCHAIVVSTFAEFDVALTTAKTSSYKTVMLATDFTFDSTTYKGAAGGSETVYTGFDGTEYSISVAPLKDGTSTILFKKNLTGLTIDLGGRSITEIPANTLDLTGYGFTIRNGNITGSSTQTMFINWVNTKSTTPTGKLHKAYEAAVVATEDKYITLEKLVVKGALRIGYSPVKIIDVEINNTMSGAGGLDCVGSHILLNGVNKFYSKATNGIGMSVSGYGDIILESGYTFAQGVKNTTTGKGVTVSYGSFVQNGASSLEIVGDDEGISISNNGIVTIANKAQLSITVSNTSTGPFTSASTPYIVAADGTTFSDNR